MYRFTYGKGIPDIPEYTWPHPKKKAKKKRAQKKKAKPRAMIERDNKIALLRSVLGRLVNDSMYKDHPEASQMALDALKRTE